MESLPSSPADLSLPVCPQLPHKGSACLCFIPHTADVKFPVSVISGTPCHHLEKPDPFMEVSLLYSMPFSQASLATAPLPSLPALVVLTSTQRSQVPKYDPILSPPVACMCCCLCLKSSPPTFIFTPFKVSSAKYSGRPSAATHILVE